MATQAMMHQRNLESSILFMQSEHAKTLKGLHDEIQTLQKKCQDLTFTLNMQGITDEDTGQPGSKVEDLKKEIQQKNEEQKEMCQELQKKEKQIKQLETDVKRAKIKHQEELRKKTETVDQLRADVESKSNQVAYLTTELHKLKKLQLESAPKQAYLAHGIMPAPPKEPVAMNIRRGHMRHAVQRKPDHTEREINPVRGSSGSSTRSDSPVMEIARSFIERDEKPGRVKERKLPLLPPIRPSSTERQSRPVLVKHVVAPSNRKKHVGIAQEVQVIAVDNVANSDQKWATRAQESHSTELN